MALTVTATDTELQKPVNVVFQQEFLRRAQQMCPYFVGSMPGVLNKQAGTSTIKWRRIEQETPTTTALAELTGNASYMQGRSADTPTFTDVVATVSKYGQFYIINEEVDLFNPNGTTSELVAVLAESAGRSLNQLQRDLMEDNATAIYADNVASLGLVDMKIAATDLDNAVNVLTKNAARTFTPMTTGSQNIGTSALLPAYWAICHPDVAYDIAKLTGFVSVQNYASQTSTATGEFGWYGIAGRAVRFLMSEDAGVDINTGNNVSTNDLRATSGLVDTYNTVIFGREAFGSVGLGMRHTDGTYMAGENMDSFEIINKPVGSGGTSDPFNEIGTLAWKAWWAGAVLNANWSRRIVSGATDLTN